VWLTPFDRPFSPADAALRLARLPGLAWLDGGLEHGREGRFSFVSTAPCEVLERALRAPSSLALFDQLARARNDQANALTDADLSDEDVPHWVGHVAYDTFSAGLSHEPVDALRSAPALRFARYGAWFAYDHERERAYLVGDDQASCSKLAERLQAEPLAHGELAFHAGDVSVTSSPRHQRAIESALALIREGELYEINLARHFHAAFAGSALGLFLRMRSESPVPLGYFVEGDRHAVLGRSMERFLRFRTSDRSLYTSPIKGTLARAGDLDGEAARLLADPKEQAEHAMVVDLMRNDLSRVCEVASVTIGELMTVLPFAGLSHLVSTVRGRVRDGVTLRVLLENTFPPGSVTGTPKERVLRAIAELEREPRGVYTGCFGFVDRAGGCSLAVAIRTAVVQQDSVEYFAGGGIVADSDPARESAETDLKARLFLRAIAGATP
jgi:para-aminobenzoate synthetase component I